MKIKTSNKKKKAGIEKYQNSATHLYFAREMCLSSLFSKIYVTIHSIVISVILNKFTCSDQNLNKKLLQALFQIFDMDIWLNGLLMTAVKILIKLGSRKYVLKLCKSCSRNSTFRNLRNSHVCGKKLAIRKEKNL